MHDEVRRRAERVEAWANLHGDELEAATDTFLLDDEARQVFADALWLAGDVLMLVPTLERLRAANATDG